VPDDNHFLNINVNSTERSFGTQTQRLSLSIFLRSVYAFWDCAWRSLKLRSSVCWPLSMASFDTRNLGVIVFSLFYDHQHCPGVPGNIIDGINVGGVVD